MPRKKKEALVVEALDTHVFDYILTNLSTNGADFDMKPFISADDQVRFCNDIFNNVVRDAGYTPALFDFACRYAMVKYYTDIVLPESDTLTDDMNTIVYGTDMCDHIRNNINMEQYVALVQAAKEQIADFNSTINSYSAADDMYIRASALIEKIGVWADRYGEIFEKKLKSLKLDKKTLAQVSEVTQKFANVSEGELAKEIVKATKDGKVVEFPTEGK